MLQVPALSQAGGGSRTGGVNSVTAQASVSIVEPKPRSAPMVEPVNLPTIDPDNVAEMICLGKFNIQLGGPYATLLFTHPRARVGPLVDEGKLVIESVVRARIVISIDNLVAMRDLLNNLLKDVQPTTTGAGGHEPGHA